LAQEHKPKRFFGRKRRSPVSFGCLPTGFRVLPAQTFDTMNAFASLLLALSLLATISVHAKDWVVYEGKAGPGQGRHLVFLTGDEEYRSEEGLPQLAKILAERHGFKCTVLFAVNPQTGEIDPNNQNHIPGIEALDTADAVVMLWRFRELPDDKMKHFVDYLLAGKPIIAMRTSTHAFQYSKNKQSDYAKYSYNSSVWPGGFGKQVLGETWVNHWGNHKREATRGVIDTAAKNLPLFRGVEDIFGDTDVYEAHPPSDAMVLVWGQVLKGMKPDDPPADYKKKTVKGVEQPVNDPMQPVVWLRDYKNQAGKVNKTFTTTMGSSTDLKNEGFRRLLVNAAYWAVGLENKIPAKANVDYVGEYTPTMYGFGGYKKGVKPSDHELK
jgi:trehalose utilization protein